MFKAIPFEADKHYELALSWWKAHNWPQVPPLEALPPTGVVVEYEGKPVSMAWLYKTDGPATWLHFLVSDRYAPKDIRGVAVDHVIKTCELISRELGFTQLWACTQIKRSKKRYEDLGFVEADVNTTHYVKGL